MIDRSWRAQKPSNIALIKYMGKKDVEKNIPTNPSISWTLDHLVTEVCLQPLEKGPDVWEPLSSDFPFDMSALGRQKFLNHFANLKNHFGIKENFKVLSGNNFPADCGIASSASSFAALTEVSCLAFSEITGQAISIEEKARLSSRGSGSSCRSFLPGLVLWGDEGIESITSDLKNLLHMVVLVGKGAKKVSSSEAHKRVQSSLLFAGRVERSQKRLKDVMLGIAPLNWNGLYETLWAEFWDMHALFESSAPPFGYFLPGTVEILTQVQNFWERHQDGPLVTMDAGPNIHLLWRSNQSPLALEFFEKTLKRQFSCLTNLPEVGFAQV